MYFHLDAIVARTLCPRLNYIKGKSVIYNLKNDPYNPGFVAGKPKNGIIFVLSVSEQRRMQLIIPNELTFVFDRVTRYKLSLKWETLHTLTNLKLKKELKQA